ncbi:phosphatidylserine/phosphatidylglycerophosphate/cardiolipin synthase-like enzyme [Nonomuraea thailandensis]|uniref:phospholipase D n=1 Tax=Nonomuraea thailandensis TaxID=1188745 RepID=A0A9X2GTG8_9ACTN|nr:phospholipase D-like domain-containing protein [Nonomuraea thailandensis]MCP2361471.1 phosphatidylserine/phosphatidylglycerophosphate/cardiolipin synthase-like enzyme [Nonomuraea thailandensis]
MRRVLLALCVVTSLLAITSPARADVTGPPVLNAPVFNDPTADSGVAGVPSAAQSAVMDQLIRLIKATPQGAEIRFVNHQFSPGQRSSEVADQLVAAHQRGVQVKVILDSMENGANDAVTATLAAALGTSESAGSWVIRCEYPDESAVDRGCIGRNYLHSKFALFSSVVAGGVSHPNVVFQTSSNLSDWYLYNSYNDAYTFTDATVYNAYRTYFADLQAGRRKAVNPGYYWTSPTGTTHRATFFPRPVSDPDPIVSVLRLIECSYQDEAGVTRQTDIRMALTAFNKNRLAIANELVRLRGENCWVDIVYYENAAGATTKNVDDTIRQALARTVNGRAIQVTPCRFRVGTRDVVTHNKLMMIDGFYDDDITPRVYTGSANFTYMENADDAFVRISGRAVHDRYLSWFYGLRSACRQ